MATLDDAITIGRREGFLAVVSTVRADATIQSSVVNAGVLAHPVTGGTHDDWAAYDQVMAEQRRSAVLVTPARVYSN